MEISSGLEELKALSLKDQQQRLRNEVFGVSLVVILLRLGLSFDV